MDDSGTEGRTALHCAAATGHSRTLKIWLARGASTPALDVQGYTPLVLARLAGKSAAVELHNS
ncbi:MAG TPA: ankyrin repeat domain-containing protein [Anaerolineae bacterium]